MNQIGVKTICRDCGYTWLSVTKKKMVCCPNCMKKTPRGTGKSIIMKGGMNKK